MVTEVVSKNRNIILDTDEFSSVFGDFLSGSHFTHFFKGKITQKTW